jgi:hypothetical protein
MNKDSDFKIIALNIGNACPDFLTKVLQKDRPYYFYPGYQLDSQECFSVMPGEKASIYSLSEGPTINISAIAGQNGTGKSTLVEFLFMAINNLASRLGIKEDLVEIQDLEVTLYFKNVDHYRFYIKGNEPSLLAYDESGKLHSKELFQDKKELLESFYYTVAVNYSHYAYNALDLLRKRRKDWLSPLFHKNDSYQTPIVINPYRKKGVIDINSENDLVRQRLLANLMRTNIDEPFNFRLLTDHLYASKLWLRLHPGKEEDVIYEEVIKEKDNERTLKWRMESFAIDFNAVLIKVNNVVDINYKDGDYEETGDVYLDAAHYYLVRKLVTMAVKYQDYVTNFDRKTQTFAVEEVGQYVELLLTDPSHIAYKFRQTINYLRFKHYKHADIAQTALPINKLSERLYQLIDDNPDLGLRVIDLLPPPIFETDIFLATEENTSGDMISFDTLSSGEKQLIYSVSSVLYHLSNLESVVSWKKKPKLKYELVNIIFEEIELYFHPELQRRFIKYLRDGIQQLKLKTIKGINMIFVTHSPFILSDIPTENILFLQIEDKQAVQVKNNKKTFGANIHNLLSDGFFMHKGLCGAFAQEKINAVIIALNIKKELNQLEEKKKEVPNKMKDTEKARYQELLIKIIEIDFEPIPEIIDLIGEGIIANKLRQMYDEAFGLDQSTWIRKEIKRLEALLP